MASVKVAISIFDRKAPRQNSMEALKVLEVFTAFDIFCIALHILFSFKVPKKGTLFSFLIAVSSDEEYVHFRIFSYSSGYINSCDKVVVDIVGICRAIHFK